MSQTLFAFTQSWTEDERITKSEFPVLLFLYFFLPETNKQRDDVYVFVCIDDVCFFFLFFGEL